jgi:hypothetical protein
MEVSQKSFARKKPDQLVYLELGSGNGGMLLSVSEDGFRFRAVSPLRPNGLMPFAFSFDGSHRLQGIGEVEWLEDDGKSGGMRFVEVSPEFRSSIHQWLALDSSRPDPGREGTPAASTPLDTMEKIREELRRGYPNAPKADRRDAKTEPDAVTPPKREVPPQRPQSEPPHQQTTSASTGSDERVADASRFAELKRDVPDFRSASSSQTISEPQATPSVPAQSERLRNERTRSPEPPPFSPPPFTRLAESEEPAPQENASSAFLKQSEPTSPAASASTKTEPASRIPRSAVPIPTETPQSIPSAHASADALRRPFRNDPSSHSARPYIPPVEESFDAAWERAKLTAPPEAPHLSRAAAGSIIGIALAVILGALAFNFRQEIGELIVALGQKISGENHAAAPAVVPARKPETQSATDSNSNASDPSAAQSKPEATAGTQGLPPQTTGDANGTPDTRGASSGTLHDAPSSAVRDATSRESTSSPARNTTASKPANGAANSAANGATGSVPQVPPGSSVSSVIGSEPGSGQNEFDTARELLRSDHRQRDLSKAVNLLWAGVRKGYVPAVVTLADLYRRGDGVEKNCDQAQVLLVAASKKGSSEARHMLEQMAEAGCTE